MNLFSAFASGDLSGSFLSPWNFSLEYMWSYPSKRLCNFSEFLFNAQHPAHQQAAQARLVQQLVISKDLSLFGFLFTFLSFF
jgi:hypothetical protein